MTSAKNIKKIHSLSVYWESHCYYIAIHSNVLKGDLIISLSLTPGDFNCKEKSTFAEYRLTNLWKQFAIEQACNNSFRCCPTLVI